jgi:hypothetical protein
MGERVMSAKEFREYADECMRLAKVAKSVKECRALLQITETWLQAAEQWEKRQRRRAPRKRRLQSAARSQSMQFSGMS